jgi:hypothetical protein
VGTIWGGSLVLGCVFFLGYKSGLFIGHSRGFHEAMKLASQREDDGEG